MRFSSRDLSLGVTVASLCLWGGCASGEAGKAGGVDGGQVGSGGLPADGGGTVGSGGSHAGDGVGVGTDGSFTGTGQVGGGNGVVSGGNGVGGGASVADGSTGVVVTGGSGKGGGNSVVGGGSGGGSVPGAGGGRGGGTSIPGVDASSGVGGNVSIPAGLLDPDSTTVWNPGILADTELNQPLGADGLPVRTTICQTVPLDQAANLQAILNGCAAGTVVQLSAGKYTVPSTIYVPSRVVLRGQGSSGSGATTVALAQGATGPTLAIGPVDLFDQTCYNNSNYTTHVVSLTADAVKEQKTVSVAPNDGTFAAGDFALIDQADDPSIIQVGDAGGSFSRKEGRRLSQRVEIASVDKATGTLTLASPLHWTFKKSLQAQITKGESPVTKWAGIEHIWVQGGRGLGEWLGRKAGGVDVSNASQCWVKDVQTDGTLNGMHVTLTGTNRCVVRDSHFHNSAQYGFGQDNYGIVVRCGAADNLVENNIARYMNKPILFNNSGGGNVVGYNYADNEWSLDSNGGDQFQETSIDIHCTFPHMELIEGNYAAHVGASTTHGNGGYLTYFRNYVSSQQAAHPIIWSLPELIQTGNITAMQFDKGDHHMTVIGNVLGSTTNAALGVPVSLGTATASAVYMAYEDDSPSVFSLGAKSDVSVTTLRWHGNFDTVNGAVKWNPDIATHSLPASLYYTAKPAWWPSGAAWPWTGPDLAPLVGTLPAQATSKAFDYNTANNPSCAADVGNYSCP